MTGLGEDVYPAPDHIGGVNEMVEAAISAAKAGYKRKSGFMNAGDHAFAMESAARAALESLGVDLAVLAELKAGTWQAVPKVLPQSAQIAVSMNPDHWRLILSAAPQDPGGRAMTDFLGIGAAVMEWRRQQEANGAPKHRSPFTPDEIRAAEIEAAREEGRRAALSECRSMMRVWYGADLDGMLERWREDGRNPAIEAKAKEARHADA